MTGDYVLTAEQRDYIVEGIRDLKYMAKEYFHRIEDGSIRAPLQAQTFILLAKLESVLEARPI